MNILKNILITKQKEINKEQQERPIKLLEKSPYFERTVYSLSKKLRENTIGIIAEFKRASPSKGIINNKVLIEQVTKGYERAGALGISIVTDKIYFNGQDKDLTKARESVTLPILCKDFIIDEYQIIAAKALGADLILLIAEALSKKKLKALANLAKELGLEVIMELHSKKELDKISENINLIGVNNRDLKTFSVDIKHSVELSNQLPKDWVKISESGLYKPESIAYLQRFGFKGVLMGECFMRSEDPGKHCEEFIKKIN